MRCPDRWLMGCPDFRGGITMIQYACPEYSVQVCSDFRLSTLRYYTVNSASFTLVYILQ